MTHTTQDVVSSAVDRTLDELGIQGKGCVSEC